MNTNLTLTCDVCNKDTDCRIGYSNRKLQPLSFACPHCISLMYVTLDVTDAPESKFDFVRCSPSKNQSNGPFRGANPFVDLHLDFPVRFGEYKMGLTPFMMAMHDLKHTNESDPNTIFEKMAFHSQRMNQLNHFHDKAEEIKTIIRLYSGTNKQLFKKRVGEFLNADQGESLKPQDINACLYSFISFVFLPFVNFSEIKSVVDEFSSLTMRLHGKPFSDFVGQLICSNFLSILQRDCLKIYPEIYAAEMPMRPALYLDLIKQYEKAKTAARISIKDFNTYKDLYKDIIEILARQLILVAGVNNIIHRGNSNTFKVISGAALSSLEKFAGKTLSDKFKYLDDCWYSIDKEVIDAGVRNAIAHNNVQYDEIKQEITYYPEGGGIEQTVGHTLYFLDFMRMVLVLFREMHNLHHLIKCFFYYEYLVRNMESASSRNNLV